MFTTSTTRRRVLVLGMSMATAVLSLNVARARADVPTRMNFAAVLKDSTGALLNGTYTLTFEIFDGAGAGAVSQWGPETPPPLNIVDGVVLRKLGNQIPIDHTVFDDASRFMEVTIALGGGPPTILSRVKISTSAYAHRIGTVDGAAAGNMEGAMTLEDGGVPRVDLGVVDGSLKLRRSDERIAVQLSSELTMSNNAAELSLHASDDQDDNRETVELLAKSDSADDAGGQLVLRKLLEDGGQRTTVRIMAADEQQTAGFGMGGYLEIMKASGDPYFVVSGGSNNAFAPNYVRIGDPEGRHLKLDDTGFSAYDLSAPTVATASLSSSEGKLTVRCLEITGGCDLSEQFEITGGALVQAGMVVSVDPSRPGKLRLSSEAYDSTVAGIVSGAGNVRTGLIMSQKGTLEGRHPVALTGRVYCLADTTNGAIKPGDLLTTSSRHGHAMKVTDHARSQGAIIGKAMTGLNEPTGSVLVLVSLQ